MCKSLGNSYTQALRTKLAHEMCTTFKTLVREWSEKKKEKIKNNKKVTKLA